MLLVANSTAVCRAVYDLTRVIQAAGVAAPDSTTIPDTSASKNGIKRAAFISQGCGRLHRDFRRHELL